MRFALFIALLVAVANAASAQFVSPVPIIEKDLRDNTIRMRSVELERLKRESRKPVTDPSEIRDNLALAQVKADFEGIQKLQDQVVKKYKEGGDADLAQISKLAKGIRNDGRRLMSSLFGEKSAELPSNKSTDGDIRAMIIELDAAIGDFVGSALFRNPLIVDPQEALQAQKRLGAVIRLSGELYLRTRVPR